MTGWVQWEVKKYPQKHNSLDYDSFANRMSTDIVYTVKYLSDDGQENIPVPFYGADAYAVSYETAGYRKKVIVYIFTTLVEKNGKSWLRYFVGTFAFDEIKHHIIIERFVHYCGGTKSGDKFPHQQHILRKVARLDSSALYRATKSIFRVKSFPGTTQEFEGAFVRGSLYSIIMESEMNNSCLRSLKSKWEGPFFKVSCKTKLVLEVWEIEYKYSRERVDGKNSFVSPGISLQIPVNGSFEPRLCFRDVDHDPYFNEFRADIIAMCGGLYGYALSPYKSRYGEVNDGVHRYYAEFSKMTVPGAIYSKKITVPLGEEVGRDLPDDIEILSSVPVPETLSKVEKKIPKSTIVKLKAEIDGVRSLLIEKENEILKLRRAIAEAAMLISEPELFDM